MFVHNSCHSGKRLCFVHCSFTQKTHLLLRACGYHKCDTNWKLLRIIIDCLNETGSYYLIIDTHNYLSFSLERLGIYLCDKKRVILARIYNTKC